METADQRNPLLRDQQEAEKASHLSLKNTPSLTTSKDVNLGNLPPELRFKVWSCAVEPRLVLLSDLVNQPVAYPLPTVTQLNVEARHESRDGYERAGRASYVNYSRDILVCDYKLADQTTSDPAAEKIAWRAERVVFWDCVPDEERIKLPDRYSDYLAFCYHQESFGQVAFDKFWFPNAKEFWSIKIGDVDKSWKVQVDMTQPYEVRRQQSAREFRYWVDHSIIEMAPLDLSGSETRLVLREGRCGKTNCQELNAGRTQIISKVNFLDGKYEKPDDGKTWVRISAKPEDDREAANSREAINRMRWSLVERSLTFFLQWDWPDDTEGNLRRTACAT